jgi:hypothetical protein
MELAARVAYHPHRPGRRLPSLKRAAAVVAGAVVLAVAVDAALPLGHAGGAPPTRLESPGLQAPAASHAVTPRAGASTAHTERARVAVGSTSASASHPTAHAAHRVRVNPVTGLPYGEAPRLAENVEGDYDPLIDSYVNQGSYR